MTRDRAGVNAGDDSQASRNVENQEHPGENYHVEMNLGNVYSQQGDKHRLKAQNEDAASLSQKKDNFSTQTVQDETLQRTEMKDTERLNEDAPCAPNIQDEAIQRENEVRTHQEIQDKATCSGAPTVHVETLQCENEMRTNPDGQDQDRGSAPDTQDGTISTMDEMRANPNNNGNPVPNEETSDRPPEGGWGWVVCFTSMCFNGCLCANMNTFGIFLVALTDKYAGDDPRVSFEASWVGSAYIGVVFLLSMVSGILVDLLGIRTVGMIGGLLAFLGMLCSAFVPNLLLMYLTYGVVMGTGFALAFTPSLAILGHYFKRKIGLVNGLVTFGGGLIFTPSYSLTLPVLFDVIGFRNTLLCLSGLNALVVAYALSWKPRIRHRLPGDEDPKGTENRRINCSCSSKFLNRRIWRKHSYVVWIIAVAVSFLGYFVLIFHMVKHADDVLAGSSNFLLPLCLGTFNALSKLLVGPLSDHCCISRVRLQQVAFFVMGIVTTCTPLADSLPSLLFLAGVLGVCDGTVFCLFGPVAFDLVGPVDSPQALGFVFGLLALPAAVGPPFAGFMYDHYGNYNLAFYVAGVPLMAGALLMIFIPFRNNAVKVTDVALVHVQRSTNSPPTDLAVENEMNGSK